MNSKEDEIFKMKNHKIRVAFFSDILIRELDGAIKTMYQLIDRIPQDKFEYLFICGAVQKKDFSHKLIKVPSVTIPFNVCYKFAFTKFSRKKLNRILAEFNPDVVHISTPSPLGFFGLKYAVKKGIPVLSIYHTHYISYIKYYFKHIRFLIHPIESIVKKIYQKFYNKCNVVYVPTNQMTLELKECGVQKEPLKLWQRGLNLKLFNSSIRDEAYMKNLTGNNNPCLLFASRLVWEKNLETLFDIYDEVKKQKLELNFIIAGKGVAEEAARDRMKEAFFVGYLKNEMMARVYASSDIFVFPSVSETYGNVVVEAMACGCVPVIAKGGGSQSLVIDGETGFLCEPENAVDYISKIKRLLADKELKKKMQIAGFEYTRNLSWENLANIYFNDIEYLAQTSGSPVRRFSLKDRNKHSCLRKLNS